MCHEIYDNCGDDHVRNNGSRKVDPSLKFYHDIPLMITSNDNIKDKLANGTPCRGQYIVLKDNVTFKVENWNGYEVNTVHASDIKHIVCRREKKKEEDPDEYFKVDPVKLSVLVTMNSHHVFPIKGISMEQLPVNDNIATTGHKLQGVTLNNLIVKSWSYATHWVYVALSRVTSLEGLVFCERLNEQKEYTCDKELLQFEERLRKYCEAPLFTTDYEKQKYEEYEKKWNVFE